MKKRLPAEDHAITELFDITLNGHLRQGDTVGVWTFNQDLHTGVFPLQRWTGDKITSFPDQLIAFLKAQRYTKDTRFDELIPALNEVVKTSPRLTTIIFCDGDGLVSDLPWADTINNTFKQRQRQMAKGRIPFAIVVRSQIGRDGIGHYVGCTINSAESIGLPQFPPDAAAATASAQTRAATAGPCCAIAHRHRHQQTCNQSAATVGRSRSRSSATATSARARAVRPTKYSGCSRAAGASAVCSALTN